MNLRLRYEDFLAAKVAMAPVSGFVVEDHEINPLLKPHQKAMVKWACLGGRRALFAAFGLGKSFMQLEILRLVAQGLSDAQVAERLVLSPRTINAHLTSIYNKLGVNSRVAATRLALEKGLA